MPRKSEQKTELGFLERIDKVGVEQKTKIAFIERIDKISAKAWLKWAEDEDKKRKTRPNKLVKKRSEKKVETMPVLPSSAEWLNPFQKHSS